MSSPGLMSETDLFRGLLADLGIVPFTAHLLRYCHGRDEEYHAHRGDRQARNAEADTFYEADQIVRGDLARSIRLDRGTAERLLLLLRRNRGSHPRIPLVLHVRAIARILGCRRKTQYLEWFYQQYGASPSGDRLYTPGPLDPIPVVPWRVATGNKQRAVHELVEGSPAFNPEQTDDHSDRIECLRLMPVRTSIAVEYDFSTMNCLPPLGDEDSDKPMPTQSRLVGVGSFGGYEDFREQYSLTEDVPIPSASVQVLQRDIGGTVNRQTAPNIYPFFPVTPRSENQRSREIATLMNLAERAGVSIFLLPELAGGDTALLQAMAQFDSGTMRNVRLFVVGSAHTGAVPGTRANRLYAGLRRGQSLCPLPAPISERLARLAGSTASQIAPDRVLPLFHSKFAQFSFRENGRTYEEGIDRGRLLRIYVSRNCTFVLLVCLDFLLQATTDLLAALGTNLILVSAFTSECGEFEAAAHSLCVKNQAIVAVAVTGPQQNPGAIFTRPAREQTLVRVPHANGPSVIRFDPYDGFWRRFRA